jgi:hypothetical protein
MMTLQDLMLLVNIRTGARKNFAENHRQFGHVLSKRFAGPALIGFFTGTVKRREEKNAVTMQSKSSLLTAEKFTNEPILSQLNPVRTSS